MPLLAEAAETAWRWCISARINFPKLTDPITSKANRANKITEGRISRVILAGFDPVEPKRIVKGLEILEETMKAASKINPIIQKGSVEGYKKRVAKKATPDIARDNFNPSEPGANILSIDCQ